MGWSWAPGRPLSAAGARRVRARYRSSMPPCRLAYQVCNRTVTDTKHALSLGPEVDVEHLLLRPRAHRREGRERQPGFEAGAPPHIAITLGQHLRERQAQAGALLQQTGE